MFKKVRKGYLHKLKYAKIIALKMWRYTHFVCCFLIWIEQNLLAGNSKTPLCARNSSLTQLLFTNNTTGL